MGNNIILKGVGVVVAIVLAVGFKFWDKSRQSEEYKTQMVQLCAGDAACITAVGQHFDDCFDSSYSMGGRRQSGSLNAQAMAACVNQRSGQQLFTAN